MTSIPPPPPSSSRPSAKPAGSVLADFTITRGQSVDLPGGETLQFELHSHKDVTAEMGPSPLMIGGKLTKPGAAAKEFWAYVQLERSRRFTIEDEEFELVDHVYNESMHLRYFGRVQ